MILRDHQERAVEMCRAEIKRGKRAILVVSPTGSGKTIVAREIIRSSVAKGNRVLFLAHREELIRQSVAKLEAAGVCDVRVIRAGNITGTAASPVAVASIPTLTRWKTDLPKARLVIIDEAHHTAAKTWKTLAKAYGGSLLLGLTATPQRADGKPLGDIFDSIVISSTVSELTALGHLVPCRVMAPVHELESGQQAVDTGRAYLQHAGGRKVVIFCSTVEHAAGVAAAFPVPCEVVHGGLSKRERAARLARLASGETMAVASVHALVEGWDEPSVSACILLRRPAHAGTYLQAVGRILRPCIGKTDAVVIDLCGSSLVHGTPDMPRDYTLDGKGISADRKKISQCQFCGAVYQAKPGPCPVCKREVPRVAKSSSVNLDVIGVAMAEIRKKPAEDFLMKNLIEAEAKIPIRPGKQWIERAYARIKARYRL